MPSFKKSLIVEQFQGNYPKAGFIRPKVPGLFKDFPGPNFQISRTFLYTN